MITTVTLNPAIDRTVVVDTFKPGAVNRVTSSREDMGGKGINVARILLALGSEAIAAGFIGSKNLGHVRSLFERDHVSCDFVEVAAETRQNTKLIESSSHQTTDINEAGFPVSAADLSSIHAMIAQYAAQSSHVVLSGSIPPGTPVTIYRDLLSALPSSCRGVLDADGQLLMEGLAAHPFLIKPNIHELENALGRHLSSHSDIVGAAREIISTWQVSYVLVSMGGDGSILITRSQAIHAAALRVNVHNTVGAGDTMLAGFIHSLATGSSDSDALACATACGALAVSKAGTETISRQEVLQLTSQVILTEL